MAMAQMIGVGGGGSDELAKALIERNIASIEIPDGVERIGDHAFYCCDGLKSVEFSDSVTAIGESAFENCIGFSGRFIIPEGITSIESNAFKGCGGIEEIVLPESLTFLGISAFENCTGISGTVALPSGLGEIGANAFAGCENITSVVFDPNNTLLHSGAFKNMTSCADYNFTSFDTIPVLEDESVFEGISSNALIRVPKELYLTWITSEHWTKYYANIYGGEEFSGTEGLSYTWVSNENCYALNGLGSYTGDTIKVPLFYDDGTNGMQPVKRVYSSAFKGNKTIKSVTLNNLGMTADMYCFMETTALESVYNACILKDNVFFNSKKLGYIKFMDGGNIGFYSLFGCKSGIIYDFSECTAVIPLNSNANLTTGSGCKIIVPAELLNDWRNATNWTSYRSFIVSA